MYVRVAAKLNKEAVGDKKTYVEGYDELVQYLDDGGGWEGEVYVGYEAVAEADTETAVAGAAYGQELAFYYGVVVGDADAAAYDVGEVVVACGAECHSLVRSGRGYEVFHFTVADYDRLTIWHSLYVEVFHSYVLSD